MTTNDDARRKLRYVVHVLTEHRRLLEDAGRGPMPFDLEGLRLLLLANDRQAPPNVAEAFVDDPPWAMTYAMVAKRLSVSVRTVERLTAAGVIRRVLVGGAPRVTIYDLHEYVAGLRETSDERRDQKCAS